MLLGTQVAAGPGKACQGLSPVFKYQCQLARQRGVKEGNSDWRTPSPTLQAADFMASRDLFLQRASQERCSPRDARFLKPHLPQTVLRVWFTQMARGGVRGGKTETSVCEETETTAGRVCVSLWSEPAGGSAGLFEEALDYTLGVGMSLIVKWAKAPPRKVTPPFIIFTITFWNIIVRLFTFSCSIFLSLPRT